MKLARIAALLAAIMALPLPARGAQQLEKDNLAIVEETRRIRNEISLLNLLNGLYLSQQQLDRLVPLAEKAAAIRRQYLQTFAEEGTEYVKDLTALRDALYTYNGPTQEQRHAAASRHGKLDNELRQRMNDELAKLEDEARTILTEAQVAIIEEFKPCLIPPKTLSDPVAVGQVTTTEREEALLDLVRRMPAQLYQEQKGKIADAIVARAEREKGKFPADVRASAVNTFIRKMDEVRMLKDVDFALRKTELAKDFQMYDAKVTFNKAGGRELGPIGHWFLNEHAAEVLNKWKTARKSDPPSSPSVQVEEAEPRQQQAKQLSRAVSGYGGIAWKLYREREKKLVPVEKQTILKLLTEAKDSQSDEEKLKLIEDAVARLNAVEITGTSVEAVLARVGILCLQKRVPKVFYARKPAQNVLEDATGLGSKVAMAREQYENGRTTEAYATLTKVAETLSKFRN